MKINTNDICYAEVLRECDGTMFVKIIYMGQLANISLSMDNNKEVINFLDAFDIKAFDLYEVNEGSFEDIYKHFVCDYGEGKEKSFEDFLKEE